MKIREIFERLKSAALPIYGDREATMIARYILEDQCSVNYSMLVLEPEREVEINDLERFETELAAARPVQYILGNTEFFGFKFAVREGCLIPRPETEELVARVVAHSEIGARVLDIGSGSGCVAISIAKSLPQSKVVSVDVSQEALAIARQNGEMNRAEVDFAHGDALAGVENFVEGKFDVVVSNPPYIPLSERSLMRRNVLEYEPSLALFVEDSDPLIFYRKISESALQILRSGGALYYEIHESFGAEVCEMLQGLQYVDIEMFNDINDKPRVVCARMK